jgi:hypothetical protein
VGLQLQWQNPATGAWADTTGAWAGPNGGSVNLDKHCQLAIDPADATTVPDPLYEALWQAGVSAVFPAPPSATPTPSVSPSHGAHHLRRLRGD